MVITGHVAGIPVEETLAMFGPALLVLVAGVVASARARMARVKERITVLLRRARFHRA